MNESTTGGMTTDPLNDNGQAQVHFLRKEIDRIIKMTAELKNNLQKGKREVAIVYTKLQESKMWAGKILEEIGSKLPEEFRDEVKV